MSKRRADGDLDFFAKRSAPSNNGRKELFAAHLKALNSQFAGWIREQDASYRDQLWLDGVKDYQKHAEQLLQDFKDVLHEGSDNTAGTATTLNFNSSPTANARTPEAVGTSMFNKAAQQPAVITPGLSFSTPAPLSAEAPAFTFQAATSQPNGSPSPATQPLPAATASAATSGFNFGAVTPAATLQPSTTAATTVRTSTPVVMFGSSAPAFGLITTTQPPAAAATGAAASSTAATPSGGFTFGIVSATPAGNGMPETTTTTISSASQLSSHSIPPSTTFNFGASTSTATATTPPFSFGITTPAAISTAPPAAAAASGKAFAFAAAPVTTGGPVGGSGSLFNNPTGASGFSFSAANGADDAGR
eukprot:jgi/Chrzof1/9776/Cz04g15110.t1